MQFIETALYKLQCKVRCIIESIDYYPYHLHENDIEILCVLDGEVTVYDSALHQTLSYGDCYVFNANDPHKIEATRGNNIILRVQLDRNYYKQFFPTLPNSYFVCDSFTDHAYDPPELKQLRFLLAKLYSEYTKSLHPDFDCERTTCEVIGLLLSDFQYYTYQKKAGTIYGILRRPTMHHDLQYFQRIYRIIDYICLHYGDSLTLTGMAEKEFLSTAYLSRYIKEASGLNFSELVSLTRCEEAERLLAASSKNVDQIAMEVGFCNRKHLATQFKKWFGKTPTIYRNSITEDLSQKAKIKLESFDYNFALNIMNMYLDGY